ncbi:uncharacterized protein LOC124456566 [Xenia sp. Carnegie-2017]|uniref:uncharacterized protein LOC124456566 n=1 Tax=Xenia sp. Carnegie-2017 TaxID=2897299 RepID=UPI001F03C769|nr:uncharacterized protein LOC124456566 [Xenia sp. Carnegie-2017]
MDRGISGSLENFIERCRCLSFKHKKLRNFILWIMVLALTSFTLQWLNSEKSTMPRSANVERSGFLTTALDKIPPQSCEVLHPQSVLYNRIPKTGSSTTVRYVLKNKRKLKFTSKSELLTDKWYN